MSGRRPAPAEERLEVVYGLHPVMELIDSRRRHVERLFVTRDRTRGLGRVLRQAREAGIPVSHLTREALEQKLGRRSLHQGVAAQVAPVAYADVDELCARATADPHGILVFVDRVVDPRNLGAILRTCLAASVTGVVLAGDGTVGLTPAAAKTSAGAVDLIQVAREAKPARRIAELRDRGFRALALDPAGETTWDRVELTGRFILVAGGEEKGAREGVRAACDDGVSIPLGPSAESLNVAVAVGVLLFEAVRQRRAARPGP